MYIVKLPPVSNRTRAFRDRRFPMFSWILVAVAVVLTGCTTPKLPPQPAREFEPQLLNVGDRIKVAFAAAPNLDTEQQIRRDGRVNLGIVGEVVAAGKTPSQLEKELVDLFASQLVSKEIKVTVVSSSFAVFVTGAVLKPGKITPERVLTALEAVMEAGGFDTAKANMKSVTVIRQEGGETKHFKLNLKAVLDGKPTEPFYLKSHDIVYVPEKFNWF